jgi:predicted DNA-binding protein (UPF0251 family)
LARTKKDRLIQRAPHFDGFKPQGLQRKAGASIYINFEEYEAIKLCDYELLTQAEASKLMNISRPTFTRIYESVRRKIAKAFVEGSCMHFEGGNVAFANWYKCTQCKITFTLNDNTNKHCPFCKTKVITENS